MITQVIISIYLNGVATIRFSIYCVYAQFSHLFEIFIFMFCHINFGLIFI
jgi:hypothetical protein